MLEMQNLLTLYYNYTTDAGLAGTKAIIVSTVSRIRGIMGTVTLSYY